MISRSKAAHLYQINNAGILGYRPTRRSKHRNQKLNAYHNNKRKVFKDSLHAVRGAYFGAMADLFRGIKNLSGADATAALQAIRDKKLASELELIKYLER